jgi:N-acetylmuramoyl-L-alanine amidase
MKITDALIPVNEWSRPGRALKEFLAIILHWTGNPMSTAVQNRAFFSDRMNGKHGYGSAHYIVDFTGDIVRCIPDSEVAYHCGTDKEDPASERVYTDWARSVFGDYASEISSPNNASIGIELCTIDDDGNFSDATIQGAIELTAHLCRVHGVKPENIGTHHMVVGWKDCPRLWTRSPFLFNAFIEDVRRAI